MPLQPNPVYQSERISRDRLEAASRGRKRKLSENSEDDSEEVNEASMRNAITDHGRHPHRYGIASVNFKGDTRGTGNATLPSSGIAVEKEPNVFDFIAISWHGPHKCTDAEKQLIFRDLLAFFKTLTVTKNKDDQKACIMGGDFNFSINKACDNIDDSYPGLAIPTSYHRSGPETIDYFIFTSDLINILHAQQLSLDYDVGSVYTTRDRDRARAEACKTAPNQVIDHSPIFAVLDLGSPNPFSSPSKIRTREMADTARLSDSPDCSTDGAVPGSSSVESQPRQATNTICGLSRRVTSAVLLRLNVEELRLELGRRGIAVESNRRDDMSNQLGDEIDGNAKNKEGQGTVMESDLSREVSLAVLLRLHVEELRRELRRRNITPAPGDSQDGLMKRLFGEMGKEYFSKLASSTTSTKSRAGQGTVMASDLSREVSLAVLLRLHVEELRWELRGRNIITDLQDSGEESMMKRLFDEMGKEYFGQQTSSTDLGTNTRRLSREVSLAVLPRLHEDELRWELSRRKIVPAAEDSQDGLMKRLCDEMGKEYFGQQLSSVSLENSTRNRPMQKAPTEPEETDEAAPMQMAPSRATGTTDAETTLEAPASAKGIGDGLVEETRGEGQMHKSPGIAADTDDVMFVEEYMSGTDSDVGAGPTVGDSSNTSSRTAMKRKQESNTRLDTPTKRSNRWEERTKEDSTSQVATTGSPWVDEAITREQEPSLNFQNTSKSGEAPESGAGPGSSAITGMDAAAYERSMDHSPLPNVQRDGDNRFPYPVECFYFKGRSKSNLDHHHKAVHLGEKQLTFERGNFETAWKSSLNAHGKKQHQKSVVPMKGAPTGPEETNEGGTPAGATGTTDVKLTLKASTGVQGIEWALLDRVQDTRGEEKMHNAPSIAVDTDEVKFFEYGTDSDDGAGPSVGDSSNTSPGAAMKRKQDSNTRLDTPTKRSNRWEETTNENSTSNVATTGRPRVGARDNRWCCPIDRCNFKGRYQGNLDEHYNAVHKGIKPFKCEFCDFETAWKDSLKKHIKRHY
ncbi:Hypp7744 [Branchiostoma lanceolatum]|uniref:Hypp7744 protein n=1 Tax=Branchiostoma lanceolatum TaxID=7740 RepID=A0A8J9Z2Q3_BRALA|nr:Hypp7744 [Branchiostoma lanceolatum]